MPVPGGTTREVREGLLAPLQEPVALLVLLVFALDVLGQRPRRAEMIDDDRMVDDEIDRHKRIDLVGIAAERGHRVAHGGEIDDRGHAGEILHQHARRAEGDLVLFLAAIVDPRGDRLDVLLLDAAPVLVAQQIFEHDFQRERKLGDALEAVLFRRLQRVNLVSLRADGQRFAAFEAIETGHASAPGFQGGRGMSRL